MLTLSAVLIKKIKKFKCDYFSVNFTNQASPLVPMSISIVPLYIFFFHKIMPLTKKKNFLFAEEFQK